MSSIFQVNEATANKSVARVMLVTLGIFTIVLALDIIGIFVIKKSVMIAAYSMSCVLLTIPTIFNRIFGLNKSFLKYVYVGIACLFILLISITLTYHVVVVYAFPIAVAGMYFSKKMVRFSIFATIIVTTVGQIVGYNCKFNLDLNFLTLKRLVLFGIIPRIFTLTCFAELLSLLTTRTAKLLEYQENDQKRISRFDTDMLTAFASLVESRDENTGGHIKRTREYVKLIVKELKKRSMFSEIIDDEFIRNIVKAAPLHDIGKIAIKDNVLQKEGKLTAEEFDEMKKHAVAGGSIIRKNFAHIGDKSFRNIVYEMATHHHEKWNGKGYPDGLKGEEIPLCARIMTVADVFDAVSQDRCYRAAMPIEKCFEIIEAGSGEDFDPEIARIFLSIKDKVIKVKNNQGRPEK